MNPYKFTVLNVDFMVKFGFPGLNFQEPKVGFTDVKDEVIIHNEVPIIG